MRLSTSTNIHIFDQNQNYAVPMEKAFDLLAEAGYRRADAALSAACRPGQPMTEDGWLEWVKAMRAAKDKAGLQVSQSHGYWPITYEVFPDFTRSDGALGELLMERSIIASEILGVEWMVVHPLNVLDGGVYSPPKSFEYNLAYFTRWGKLAGEHNVGIAIENMPHPSGEGRFCVQIPELNRLVDEIALPNVGACLDTGHAHLSRIDAADAVRALGRRLKATHIADNHQNKDEHFAPFNGTIDWPKVMAALREIQYPHDFAFEIHHLTSPYPACLHRELIQFSYQLGNYLLQC